MTLPDDVASDFTRPSTRATSAGVNEAIFSTGRLFALKRLSLPGGLFVLFLVRFSFRALPMMAKIYKKYSVATLKSIA